LSDTLLQPSEKLGRKVALGEITSPIVRAGYEYWLLKKGDKAYPSRDEIKPAEIKKLLPNVILVHVLDGGRDYQFRVVGEAISSAHGFNALNWHLDQLDAQVNGYTAMMRNLFAHLLKTGWPFFAKGSLVHIDRGYQSYESVYLPLGPKSGPIDHLLNFSDYFGEVAAGNCHGTG